MKKSGIIMVLLGLFLLASCSDVWIVKRKYNRGYFIDFHHKEKVQVAEQKRELRLLHRSLSKALNKKGLSEDAFAMAGNPSALNTTLPFNEKPDEKVFVEPQEKAALSQSGNAPCMPTEKVQRIERVKNGRILTPSKVAARKSAPGSNKFRLSYGLWFAGLSVLFLMQVASTKMMRNHSGKMAAWAASHPARARWAIAAMSISLAGMGLFGGHQLFMAGVEMKPELIYTGFALGGVSILMNHFAGGRTWKRKVLWPLMLISGLALSVPSGNQAARVAPHQNPMISVAQSTRQFTSELYGNKENHFKPLAFHSVLNKDRVQTPPDENPKMSVGKAFVIIFMVSLFFLMLSYLIWAISCTFYCEGSIFLGNLVLYGGMALNLALLVLVIVRVAQKRRATKQWEQFQPAE